VAPLKLASGQDGILLSSKLHCMTLYLLTSNERYYLSKKLVNYT